VKLTVSRNNVNILHYESPQLKLSDKYEVFLGRSLDCHIFLDDQLVSRHHAVLKYQNGTWSLFKLSSFGGLILNGINVEQADLHLGDVITIYDFVIKIDELDQSYKNTKPVEQVKTHQSTSISDEEANQDVQAEQTEDFNTIEESIPQSESGEDDNIQSEFADDSETETFTDDSAGEFSGDGFEETKEEGSTRVLSSFANFELSISGEYAPYDRYTILDNEVFIGRDPEKCQIVLDDPEVSSVHAKVKKTLISCSIEDLNSSNGTVVNGNRINKVELNNGDEIVIGSTTFVLQVKLWKIVQPSDAND